jgi:hypothetical protein
MSTCSGGTGRNGQGVDAIAQRVRSHALSTGIAAGLLLFFGFFRGLSADTGNVLYDGSVTAFTWSLKIGGITLGAAALGCLSGLRWAMMLDGAASIVLGAVFVGVAAVWTVNGDMDGVLVGIFSIMFLYAGRSAIAECVQFGQVTDRPPTDKQDVEEAETRSPAGWEARLSRWASAKRQQDAAEGASTSASPAKDETVASEPPRESSAPGGGIGTAKGALAAEEAAASSAGEQAPPEGFLAALAREKGSGKSRPL